MAKAKSNPYQIKHDFDDQTQRVLFAQGAPRSSFMRANNVLDLETSVQPFEAQLSGGGAAKRVTAKQQLDAALRVMSSPLRGHYLFVISSFPTESKGMALAAYIMAQAVGSYYEQRANGNPSYSRQDLPQWHRIMGFRMAEQQVAKEKRPSMLVLSNVVDTSTPHKYETLRDMLSFYDDVPRVLVTSGVDPLTFAAEWLRVEPNGVIQLGPEQAQVQRL